MGNAYDYETYEVRAVSGQRRGVDPVEAARKRIRGWIREATAIALEWGYALNIGVNDVAEAHVVRTRDGKKYAYVFTLKTGTWIEVNMVRKRVDTGHEARG